MGVEKGRKMTNLMHYEGGTRSKTIEYETYSGIKSRCYNPNDPAYKYYGGRGIKMCDRWNESFDNFFEDMGLRPDGLEIDRINVNGNYSPNNCRWTTHKENMRNRSNTVLSKEKAIGVIALRDMGLKIREIAESIGISENNVENVLYKPIWR